MTLAEEVCWNCLQDREKQGLLCLCTVNGFTLKLGATIVKEYMSREEFEIFLDKNSLIFQNIQKGQYVITHLLLSFLR